MIINIWKAKAMLEAGKAGLRGYTEETDGLTYAIVDDLEKQVTCHVCDPNHLLEMLYTRADRGTSENKEKALIEKLTVDLFMAAGRVNEAAKNKDFDTNRTNYGAASKCVNILMYLGQAVDFPCWEDDGFLKIPKVVVNDKSIGF